METFDVILVDAHIGDDEWLSINLHKELQSLLKQAQFGIFAQQCPRHGRLLWA